MPAYDGPYPAFEAPDPFPQTPRAMYENLPKHLQLAYCWLYWVWRTARFPAGSNSCLVSDWPLLPAILRRHNFPPDRPVANFYGGALAHPDFLASRPLGLSYLYDLPRTHPVAVQILNGLRDEYLKRL